MKLTLKHLRQQAIASSLFPPTILRRAVERMGFVQADPIRSPARAQDLILRHRVKAYKAGNLEALYPSLGLEEDFLYAYGFMPQATWRLLHPRLPNKLKAAEKQVLEIIASQKQIHPRDLEAHLGKRREINPWGGYSKSTTRTLHRLHYRGLLRIAGRENGIRLYEAVTAQHELCDPAERLRQLVLLIARILAPLPQQSLRETLRHLRYAAPSLKGRLSAVRDLLQTGDLAGAVVDGVHYVWPADWSPKTLPAEHVRFLAPFDPLVWDRRRFEHFWGWPYRFEAYTPPSKRQLGYYAMPMLWRNDVVGWVNIDAKAGIEAGFVKTDSIDNTFWTEFEAESQRFRAFLSIAGKR